jgi:hypothetical protein
MPSGAPAVTGPGNAIVAGAGPGAPASAKLPMATVAAVSVPFSS